MNIRISIALVKSSASFVASNMTVLYVPIYTLLFIAFFASLWIVGAVYLFSCGDITGSTGGS